ncbi:hypothetical protein A0U40_17525 [[Bacillus] sp. KCTC 13219]|nr:hypothetical protein A0U40_17525 [[Bacillus] sp. KCTC 13219]
MKNNKLRLVWINLNVFCYCMFIGLSAINMQQSEKMNASAIWILLLLLLLLVSLFGSNQLRLGVIAARFFSSLLEKDL